MSVLEGLVAELGWSVSSQGAVHVAGIFRLCLVSSRLRLGSGVVGAGSLASPGPNLGAKACSPRLGVCGFPRTLSCVFSVGWVSQSSCCFYSSADRKCSGAELFVSRCVVRAIGLGSRVPFSGGFAALVGLSRLSPAFGLVSLISWPFCSSDLRRVSLSSPSCTCV